MEDALENSAQIVAIIRDRLDRSKSPLFLHLVEIISEEIGTGRFPRGNKFPPYRILSKELELSGWTVQRAYRELERQSLLVPRTGDGTYILEPSPLNGEKFGNAPVTDAPSTGANAPLMDLSRNQFLLEKDLDKWAELYDFSNTDHEHLFNMLNYTDERGLHAHRLAGVRWMSNHGLNISPDNIFCTNGAQHGIYLAVNAFMRPHESIAVDTYTYPGLLALARSMGIRIVSIAHDEQGLCPNDLEEKIAGKEISAVFTTPTVQNPLNYQITDNRRDEIAEVCQKHRVFIIEDETQGILLGQPFRSFYDRLPEQTALISGMSKAMSSGLRIGYIAVPGKHRERFSEAMKNICWMATPLSHEIAARSIAAGFAEESMQGIRVEIERRRKLIDEILAGVEYASADRSPHYWISLPKSMKDTEAVDMLAEANIKVSPSHQFKSSHEQKRHYIRASITSYNGDDSISQAFEEIRVCVDGGARRKVS